MYNSSMQTKVLTERSQEVYDFILSYARSNGRMPTVREIGDAVNMSSTNTVAKHIDRLIKFGLLQKSEYTPRGIEFTQYRFVTRLVKNDDDAMQGEAVTE